MRTLGAFLVGAVLLLVILLAGHVPPFMWARPPTAFGDSTEHLYCARGAQTLIMHWTPARTIQRGIGLVIPDTNPCGRFTVALVHNHPSGERCWYTFPGTSVPTSDELAAKASKYKWDGIWCKNHIIWRHR